MICDNKLKTVSYLIQGQVLQTYYQFKNQVRVIIQTDITEIKYSIFKHIKPILLNQSNKNNDNDHLRVLQNDIHNQQHHNDNLEDNQTLKQINQQTHQQPAQQLSSQQQTTEQQTPKQIIYESDEEQMKEQCHFSCLTCSGKEIDQCNSCNSETRAFIQQKYCICKDGYMDVGRGECKKIDISPIKQKVLKYLNISNNVIFLILVAFNRFPNVYFNLINLSSMISYDIYTQPLSNPFGQKLYLEVMLTDNYSELIPSFLKGSYMIDFQQKIQLLRNSSEDFPLKFQLNHISQYLVLNCLSLFIIFAILSILYISFRNIEIKYVKGVKWNLFLVIHFLTFQDQVFYALLAMMNISKVINSELGIISLILFIQLIAINFIVFFFVYKSIRHNQQQQGAFNMIFLFRDIKLWPVYILNLSLKAINALNAVFADNKIQINILVIIISIKCSIDLVFLFKKYYFQLRKSYFLAFQIFGLLIYLSNVISMANQAQFLDANQKEFENASIFLEYQNILFQIAIIFKIIIGLIELLASIINWKFVLFVYYHQKKQNRLINLNDSPISFSLDNPNSPEQNQQQLSDSIVSIQYPNQINLFEQQRSPIHSPNRIAINNLFKKSEFKIYKLNKL